MNNFLQDTSPTTRMILKYRNFEDEKSSCKFIYTDLSERFCRSFQHWRLWSRRNFKFRTNTLTQWPNVYLLLRFFWFGSQNFCVFYEIWIFAMCQVSVAHLVLRAGFPKPIFIFQKFDFFFLLLSVFRILDKMATVKVVTVVNLDS